MTAQLFSVTLIKDIGQGSLPETENYLFTKVRDAAQRFRQITGRTAKTGRLPFPVRDPPSVLARAFLIDGRWLPGNKCRVELAEAYCLVEVLFVDKKEEK